MKRILLLLILVPLFSYSFADIANPDQFAQDIKFTNLDEFPDYQFYYLYKQYGYDRGYRVSSERQVLLKNNEVYETSSRYGAVRIYACQRKKRNKDKMRKGKYCFHSEEEIGGNGSWRGEDPNKVAVYEVEKLEEGIITLKRIGGPEGNAGNEEYRGTLPLNNPWYKFLLPGLCLSALVGFFLIRRRKATQRTA